MSSFALSSAALLLACGAGEDGEPGATAADDVPGTNSPTAGNASTGGGDNNLGSGGTSASVPGTGGATNGGGTTGAGGSGVGGSEAPGGGHCGDVPVAPQSYCVVGAEVVRDSDGAEVLFRGANTPGMEWYGGWNSSTEENFKALGNWGANIVRIPLNQEYWLNTSEYPSYRTWVSERVQWANAAGLVAILDLHRLADSREENSQHDMPDADSPTFWSQVAAAYKDNGQVFFELYNEPKGISDWDEWKDGGSNENGAFVGMESLYAAIRGTGAHNVVLVGGLNWAYSLEGVLSRPFADSYNVAYVTHLYNYGGKQPDEWAEDWLFVAESAPVFITEFGIGGDFDDQGAAYASTVLSTAASSDLHWTAWALFPFQNNAMVTDAWDPGTGQFPLTPYGQSVVDAF